MNRLSLAILFLMLTKPAFGEPPSMPDPTLTPGDVLTTDQAKICTPGYSKTVRNVPESEKLAVYREYGITSHAPGSFEVDHLISLELGGSNDVKNLWAESYLSQPFNAHIKDKLENKLHALVCSGRISIEEAQHEIATDWIGAYRKWVGMMP